MPISLPSISGVSSQWGTRKLHSSRFIFSSVSTSASLSHGFICLLCHINHRNSIQEWNTTLASSAIISTLAGTPSKSFRRLSTEWKVFHLPSLPSIYPVRMLYIISHIHLYWSPVRSWSKASRREKQNQASKALEAAWILMVFSRMEIAS